MQLSCQWIGDVVGGEGLENVRMDSLSDISLVRNSRGPFLQYSHEEWTPDCCCAAQWLVFPKSQCQQLCQMAMKLAFGEDR
jgi:hypothetical protein